MLVLTVSQLLQSAEGSVPQAFQGIVKKVWPSTAGTNTQTQRPWKLQKLIVTGVGGEGEIEVMFDNRSDVPSSVEGSRLYACARNSQRGLTGLKIKLNKRNDKLQAWVYDLADVSFEGANGHVASTPPANQAGNRVASQNGHLNGNTKPDTNARDTRQQNGSTAAKGPESVQAPAEQPAPVDPVAERLRLIKKFDRRLGRNCAALNRCFDAAFKLAKDVHNRHEKDGGFKPTSSDIKELATTLFIQTCWTEKAADMAHFPISEFQNYEAEAAAKNKTSPSEPQQHRQGAPFQS
jgi:hypothetical protein